MHNLNTNISSDYSSYNTNISTENKEDMSICRYYNLDMLHSYDYTRFYFEGFAQNFYDQKMPDFCMAGDYIKMRYYGEINEVIIDQHIF